MVVEMAARLKIPNDFRDLGVITARYHGVAHRAFELRPGTILRLLERLDGFRRPDRFREFLIACEADMRGRAGLSTTAYPQAELLDGALAAARNVATPAGEGLTGEQIGQQLREARLRVVADWVRTRREPINQPR